MRGLVFVFGYLAARCSEPRHRGDLVWEMGEDKDLGWRVLLERKRT